MRPVIARISALVLAGAGSFGAQEVDPSGLQVLLNRAAAARARPYPGLSYLHANVSKRVSIAVAAGNDQPSRLINRHESAARIEWGAATGYRIALLGSRTALPAMGRGMEPESQADMLGGPPLPVVPGEDLFWFAEGLRQHLGIDPSRFEHPLGGDADRHYRRTPGDSVRLRTPDGQSRVLHEVRIAPRSRRWNLIEGSLWLDAVDGSLAAAQYRLAGTITATRGESASRFSPAHAELGHIALENALVENRWWLPRLQVVSVSGARLGMVVDVTVQHRFDVMATAAPDTLFSRAEWPVSVPAPRTQCASSDTWTEQRARRAGTIHTLITRPCDRQRLVVAPELPHELFDADPVFFGRTLGGPRDRSIAGDGVIARAAGPAVRWGFDLWRFDRIRGLAIGVDVERALASRTRLFARLRPSLGDRQLRGTLGVARAVQGGSVGLRVSRSLATPNPFEPPEARTASLAAAFLGRDPHLYHDAIGVAVVADAFLKGSVDLRVFAERQRTVAATQAHALFGQRLPTGNPAAEPGTWGGVRLRVRTPRRGAPLGFRVTPLLELEAAERVDSAGRYGRVSASSAFLIPVASRSAISVQMRAATSAGAVPRQLHWSLGGPTGVRGQDPERVRGDALWQARGEFAVGSAALRLAAFHDIGWAGHRRSWTRQGATSSGGGLGVSAVDGLLRVDVSRGLRPRTGWRIDLQVETAP